MRTQPSTPFQQKMRRHAVTERGQPRKRKLPYDQVHTGLIAGAWRQSDNTAWFRFRDGVWYEYPDFDPANFMAVLASDRKTTTFMRWFWRGGHRGGVALRNHYPPDNYDMHFGTW